MMMKFELLDPKKHRRKQFDCGVEALNLYLQHFANQDQKKDLSRAHVLADDAHIIGFYSICSHSVLTTELPNSHQTTRYPYSPFLLLGRLAVDKRHQGKGYGDALIFHAFSTTTGAAEKVGISGLLVDAKDEEAVNFYEKFGFKRLSASPFRLFLPLSNIRRIIDSL